MGAEHEGPPISPIFRNCPKLVDGVLGPLTFFGMDKAVIDMIVDERTFRARDSILDCLKLLRNIDAWSLIVDHANDAAQMAGSAVQPLDDVRVTGVSVMSHPAM